MWVPQVTESVFTECVTPAPTDTSTRPFPVIDYVEIDPPSTAPACMTEHQDLLCRQPDTYVHHGELRYGTMGLIVFSFSAAGEREIVSDAREKSSYTDLSHDTKRKSITKMDMKETFGLPDRNINFSMFYGGDWAVVRRNVVDGNCRNETLLHCPGLRHLPTSVVDTDRNKTCEVHGGNIISSQQFWWLLIRVKALGGCSTRKCTRYGPKSSLEVVNVAQKIENILQPVYTWKGT